MSPYPQPLPGPSTSNRKKEAVKFSTLDHPPRANLLPPAALLSLLCLAFLCLLFVCFRHTEWIVKARKKVWTLLKEQANKLSDQFEEFKFNRQRRIKLLDDDDDDGQEEGEGRAPTMGSGGGSRLSSNLQSLNLSHHHRESAIDPLTLTEQDEEEEDEDNEVLPQVLYSK
ncbi:hypothetical protein PGT21_020255 [Puccinia graminis f. sp. tritici]|uniref:Uncharacterized protein n=1 Tax=Puccinia graminis f. sp. tritici TaxID=56615 RepID=A0A5B0PPA3_PUCGR|nr:hypothetical protein PGT21_020255 [Puccinia graminis f. sp. tritici]